MSLELIVFSRRLMAAWYPPSTRLLQIRDYSTEKAARLTPGYGPVIKAKGEGENGVDGDLTLHPAGLPHEPHPKAFAIGKQALRKETNEVAVMIDTRDALEVAKLPEGVEWEAYVDSWKGGEG